MPLTREILGGRIRSARESCQLTQEQVGQLAGLHRVAIGQIEAGTRSVSSVELAQFAHVLRVDIRQFFAESFVEQDPLAALFRADAALAESPELLEALQVSLSLGRELANLEQLLGVRRAHVVAASYELPPPVTRWEAIQQGIRVATEERLRLGLGAAPVVHFGDLLESQGIRLALLALPDSISGITLINGAVGVLVAVNATHAATRLRFSLAHEYAHVLCDRNRKGLVSRAENRSELLEVRANAFAAEFLMPADGVHQYIARLGKGHGSRTQVVVFDEMEAVQAEQRAVPNSQDIQLYDVVLLAHQFGVSRRSAIYRLKNLRLLTEGEVQRLRAEEEAGAGRSLAEFLHATERDGGDRWHEDVRRRALALALEAYRREEITRAKLTELAQLIGPNAIDLGAVLRTATLD
jgi:Zn-dependent peptidase ImmA (M78 family)/DNA-binding XRE family transcriptional regulator